MTDTLKVDGDIENMLIAAHSAGCTEDQMENFVTAGYVILSGDDGHPGYEKFHAWAREADLPGGPEWIALGGKRGPGKSYAVMAQCGLDDMQRVAGLKGLFLRKIQKSAAESMEDLVRRVFNYVPHSQTNDGIRLKNVSQLVIGGYKDENDIDKYLGIEYDFIVIEEATQLSQLKVLKIRGSLRTSKAGWRPRIYLTTNADGIGLLWFKNMFLVPARAHAEKETRFLDVSHVVNPFINPEYNAWLATLTGNLGKAWNEGDWDAFAGMAFPEWNRRRHVVKPFAIPDHWVKLKATDWGSAAPFCTLWGAENPDTGRIYVYRELYKAGLTDRQQARTILAMSPPNEVYLIHYADPSIWEKKSHRGEVFSTADEYREEGIILTRADNDRIAGMRRVHSALADLPDGRPGIIFFNTCPHIIEQISSLASGEPPRDPEDIADNQEDHAFDTLKYMLTNKKRLDKKPPKPRQINPLLQVFSRR